MFVPRPNVVYLRIVDIYGELGSKEIMEIPNKILNGISTYTLKYNVQKQLFGIKIESE